MVEIAAMPKGEPPPFVYDPPREPWLDIVYMDNDILLLNKPSGLLSVPGKREGLGDCAQARVRARFPRANNVHRLDLDTSGLMLFGLNPKAHRYLSIGFERRLVEKSYVALVDGEMEEEEGLVDLPICVDWENRPRQKIDFRKGRPSQTAWRVIAREDGRTRLQLTPLTGRSHQLRIHMAAIGHPILGDPFYAFEPVRMAAPRLLLHAASLRFRHPKGGHYVSFTAPAPF